MSDEGMSGDMLERYARGEASVPIATFVRDVLRHLLERWDAAEARATAAERERDALREALRNALASLVAATSLLERGGKKAAPSDKMFAQMLVDYNKSAAAARAALTANHSAPQDNNDAG